MSIEGKAEASNGYSYGPVRINTVDYPELHVKLSGTENARFYVGPRCKPFSRISPATRVGRE